MNAKFNYQSYFLRTALALAGRKDEHKENRPSCALLCCALNKRIRTIRRLLLLLAVVTAALNPADSRATEMVEFLYSQGNILSYPATAIESTSGDLSLNGWYYVSGSVTIGGNLTFSGICDIILCDGATLTVTGDINAAANNSYLYIFAQSNGSSMGKLRAGNISKEGHNYVYCGIYGGDIELTGFDGYFFLFYSGHFSATSINTSDNCDLSLCQSTDWIKVGTYTVGNSLRLYSTMMVDNGPTTVGSGTVNPSEINGKKLSVPPSSITPIGPATDITNGTVVLNKTQVINNEYVTATFTPAAGYILAGATVIDDGGTHAADATALSTGRWNFKVTRSSSGGLSAFTVNATFVTPVAQIGDTKYPTLQAAFDAIANNETIDILSDITEATAGKEYTGDHNHTINLNGKNVTFNSHSALGSLTINGPGTLTCKTLDNPSAGNSQTLTINGATVVCNGVAGDPPTTSIQWMADHIVLTGGADLTAKNLVFLGGGDGEFTFTIDDNASIAHLVDCKISGYDDTNKAHIVQLRQYVNPNDRSYYDTQTSENAAVTVDLRQSWGIELADGLGEISPGVPKAAVTFYDGGTSFDPTAFSPSAYTTSTLYVDNSDGKDHYVIAYIVPDPFYWTDLSLLTHQESKSSGADTPAGLTLLKADQYNVNALDPSLTPDWRDRLDGAGWYYYILPGSKTVANDYTTSSIGGEVVEMFNLSTMTATQDFTNKTITYSRTTDDWTAVLTYDKMRWKFNGTTEFPQLTKVVINKAGTAVYTLDNATDIANHLTNNYSGNQFVVDYDTPIQPSSANSYCWFFGYDGNSYFTVEVPFTTPSTTPPLGSANNQWLIRNADELNLLSKCFSIGCWLSGGQYFLQTDDINMSGVNDFLPIGVNNPGPSFQGNYDGNGKTISNLSVTYSKALIPGDPTNAYIGLFGLVEGTSDAKASVDNVTLKNCSFSATAGSCAAAVGGIAGSINEDATISNCKVLTTSAISGLSTGCATGAIIGTFTVGTLSKNYYGYGVTVTNSSGTAKEYTKRGLWMGSTSSDGGPTTYAWSDFTLSDGAVLWVKKASFETITKPDGSTSTIAFSQKTPGDNCYALDGNDVLYAVGQPITLTVTEGQSKADGLRTFYDGLSGLTVNGSSDGVDLANRSFSMPETDATIAATFTPSKWFTILSNGKAWMSFYHEWKDANNAPENYTVSDYNTAGAATPKTIEVKTITAADSKTGEVTFGSLEGVSYSGMPTLFHCETVLPDVLKFTPNTTATTTVTPATQFIGVAEATQLSGDGIYVMNGDGDFIWASDTSEKLGAHKCYVDLGKAAGRRLTVISDDNATGIHSIDNGPSTMDDADGAWYSIDGRKLQVKPTKKGLYIYKGKKTVIK